MVSSAPWAQWYTVIMIYAAAPSYTFNGHLAQELGLEAAVLYDVLRRIEAIETTRGDHQDTVLNRPERDWLALVPFLSPGRFLAALDRLVDAGLVAETRAHADGRSIRLTSGPAVPASPAPSSEAPASSEPPPDDRADDDLDMPPPAPTTRLLTDGQDRVRTTGRRPRYSDQPLYMQSQPEARSVTSAPGKADGRDSATEMSTMSLDWQPSSDCLRMIEGKGIETDFALAQRESFVLYYRDSGQRHISWDTKFLNWVSRRWQYHLNDRQHDARFTENSPGSGQDRRRKLRSRLRNIGDFDW